MAAELPLTFDRLQEMCGVGRAQYFLLFLYGLANASDSVEIAVVSFVVTSKAECDLDLDSERKGALVSVLFAGMLIGGWLWGSLADSQGRKKPFLIALGLNASAGLASALAINYTEFAVLRFISGLGIGGSIPVLFSYFSEFVPPASRGKMISIVAAFWMVGQIIVSALALAIMSPSVCDRDSSDERSRTQVCLEQDLLPCGRDELFGAEVPSWRLFLAATSVPVVICTILAIFIPESPRWLFENGHERRAESVLRWIAKTNNVTLPASPMAVQARINGADSRVAPKKLLMLPSELFEPPFRRNMLLLIGIWSFLSFGFYGFTLWLPTYFKSGGISDSDDIYLISFIVALGNLPGNLFAIWAVDRLGRKKTLLVSLGGSGACVFVIFAISSTAGTTAFSAIFAGISVAAWNAIDVLAVELFPTRIRSSAFGIQASCGRLASIISSSVFGVLADDNAAVPILLTGCALFAGGICSTALPSKAIQDHI